ncbi:hypothetical protein, partial [Pseudomonas mediterranea]
IGGGCIAFVRRRAPVGASLLAMTAAHPTFSYLIHRSPICPRNTGAGGFPLHTVKHIFGFSHMSQTT